MKPFIKVIAKSPWEKWGKPTNIENDLEAFQKAVGGNIEVVRFDNVLIICNEEGKLLGLPKNMPLPNGDWLVGNIIVCGADDEDFTDCPLKMKEWKELITPLVETPCEWFIFYNESTGRLQAMQLGNNIAYNIEGTVIKSFFGLRADVQKEIRRLENEQLYKPRNKFYNSTACSRK